jgi:hypothetical protein
LKILSPTELRYLTVERLLAYRKKALSIENSQAESDFYDAGPLDMTYIWFKEDPWWQAVYSDILAELARKQSQGNA